MGVKTKRVKQIVRLPDVDYVANGKDDLRICYRYDDDIAVCYAPADPPVVVSVLWHTQERYERAQG
jgi:hypothetical protein